MLLCCRSRAWRTLVLRDPMLPSGSSVSSMCPGRSAFQGHRADRGPLTVARTERNFSIRFDDPAIGIDWPVRQPLLSRRDESALSLEQSRDRLPRYAPR